MRNAPQIQTIDVSIECIRLFENPTRDHSPGQIRKLRSSIREFGFLQPILIDSNDAVIAGAARLQAARDLGMPTIPCIRISHLDESERRAYAIADNKIAELGTWNEKNLITELQFLAEQEIAFDLEVTGFETAELDFYILQDAEAAPDVNETETVPAPPSEPTTQSGDLWLCGPHRVLCADSTDPASYQRLLGEVLVDMAFTDPPYNVPISGHVRSKTSSHRDFHVASGEMTSEDFANFLGLVMRNMACVSRAGALHYVCMDWRHMSEVLAAGKEAYGDLLNVCVWNKTNGGMGSFYRSKHELVFVWKNGKAAHINNIELGKHGRYRTNVWDYAGVNSFGETRASDLADHPTVKPTDLVFDAILDCTKRGDAVLDPFLGSGTSLLAAERAGRIAYGIEYDAAYVDVALRRWHEMTGDVPRHAKTGASWQARSMEDASHG